MGQTEEFRQRLLPIEAWTSLLGEPISQNGPWGQGLYGPVKRGDCGVPWVTLMSSFARFEMEILHKTPSQEHQKARSKEKKKEGALPLLGQAGRPKRLLAPLQSTGTHLAKVLDFLPLPPRS